MLKSEREYKIQTPEDHWAEMFNDPKQESVVVIKTKYLRTFALLVLLTVFTLLLNAWN